MGYGIGPSKASIIYFRSSGSLLECPPPKGYFQEGSELRDLSSGGARLVGYPIVRWVWGFLTNSQYDVLRSICPEASGTIFISTTTNDNLDSFGIFQARYVWPLELRKDTHFRMEFELLFKRVIPA